MIPQFCFSLFLPCLLHSTLYVVDSDHSGTLNFDEWLRMTHPTSTKKERVIFHSWIVEVRRAGSGGYS